MTDTPPQNRDAEESVLGALLQSPAALEACAELLTGEDFYRPSNGRTFTAALELSAKGTPVDVLTLTHHLGEKVSEVGGEMRLRELALLQPSTANAAHYARIVKDTSVARALVEAGREIIRLGHESGDGQHVDQAQQLVYAIGEASDSEELRPLGDTALKVYEEIHARAGKRGALGVSTGIRDLDKVLGGLRPGSLVILAARPGEGKSALALNIAQHITLRKELPVALFTFEMTREEVTERLISCEGQIDNTKLRDAELTDTDYRRANEVATLLAQAPLHTYDKRGLTMMQLRAKARRLKSRHPELALCIVDYLQQMVEGEAKYLVAETGKVSQALKVLAGELKVPVLALSQLNRMSVNEKRKPRASDLRDSGSLEQDADVVLFIHHDKNDGAQLLIEKNRHGPSGIYIPVSWRGQFYSFTDAHPESIRAAA